MRGLLLPVQAVSRGSCGETLRRPQSRAPGAWADIDLGGRGSQRWPRQGAQPRIVTADTHGDIRRADAAASFGLEEALDDPILERGVAQDDDPPPGPQQVEGGSKTGLQRLELLVDGDAERLEDPCRGVRPTPKTRVRRRDSLDQCGELLGGRDRRDAAGIDDRPCDARRLGLLAIAPEEGGQLGRVERGEQVGGGNAPRRIEAHVEWAARPEAEATLAIRQLIARQPEVEQTSVHGTEAGTGRDLGELAEV